MSRLTLWNNVCAKPCDSPPSVAHDGHDEALCLYSVGAGPPLQMLKDCARLSSIRLGNVKGVLLPQEVRKFSEASCNLRPV